MNPQIQHQFLNNRRQIIELCEEVQVKRLKLFGSALSEVFNPATSDIDMVVDFYDDQAPGIADRFLRLAEGLEALFDRPVDLLTRRSLRNPIFRKAVESSEQTLYEA